MTGPARTSPASPRVWRRAASLALGALLVLAACSDRDPVSARPRDARAALFDERGDSRLIVGIDDPNLRVLSVEIGGSDLKEPLSWKFERKEDGPLYGTIALPAGEERRVILRGFDGEGREVYAGESALLVDKEMTPQVRFDLKPLDEKAPGTQGWIGSYRVAIEPFTLGTPSEEPVKLTVTVRDPDGEAMPISAEDFDWEWPREVGELEIIYGEREAREVSAIWRLHEFKEIKPIDLVICEQRLKGCGRVHYGPFPFLKYAKVVGGGAHSCAIIRAFSAKCWGDNSSGQLGIDAAGVDHLWGRRWIDISAGFAHTCALDEQGAAWCWGSNGRDQLGIHGVLSIPRGVDVPVQVQNTPPFTQIAAGGEHTCALSTTGEIWCWGEWSMGQLGDGAFYSSYHAQNAVPRRIDGYDVYTAVSAGASHSCGITGGQVRCWGLNNRGQTGGYWQPSSTMNAYNCQRDVSTPVMRCNRRPTGVSIPGTAIAISSGGNRNCVLATSQEIHCWGAFALGNNALTADSMVALKVNANGGAVKFTAVGVGSSHSCGVATDGAVWCWGQNGSGQLGNGAFQLQRMPVQASGALPLASSLGLGDAHSCAVDSSGYKLLCWGNDSKGQLGISNSLGFATVPTAVTAF